MEKITLRRGTFYQGASNFVMKSTMVYMKIQLLKRNAYWADAPAGHYFHVMLMRYLFDLFFGIICHLSIFGHKYEVIGNCQKNIFTFDWSS